MKLAPGVSLNGIHPEIVIGIMVMNSCYERLGFEMHLTSICDGKHGYGSLHFCGYAADSDGIKLDGTPASVDELGDIADEMRGALTAEFDIVHGDSVHQSHIHVEYQPKYNRRA